MPDKNGKIVVKRPDGSLILATPEEAKNLKIFGYGPETFEERAARGAAEQTKEDYTTVSEKAKAVVEGLVSGASLGLSDFATDDEAKARAQYNPGTRIASEVVGALIPSVLSFGTAAPEVGAITAARIGVEGAELAKGASALSKGVELARGVSRITPAGLATRAGGAVEKLAGEGLAGKIAGGATEGLLGGAGSAITQAKLNGDPLTAESVAVNAGMGAVLGGAAGGIAHGLSSVVPYKVPEEVVSEGVGVSERTVADDALDDFYKGLPKEKAPKAKSALEAAANLPDDSVGNYIDEVEGIKGVSENVDHIYYSNIKGAVKEVVSAADTVANDADRALTKSLQDIKAFESEVGGLGKNVDEVKVNNIKAQKGAESEYNNKFKTARVEADAQHKAAMDKWKLQDKANNQIYNDLIKQYKQDVKTNPTLKPPKRPVPGKLPVLATDAEIKAGIPEVIVNDVSKQFSPLSTAYDELQKALKSKSPATAAEKLTSYQRLIKDTLSGYEAAGLPQIKGDIEKLYKSVGAAEEAVKLKQAGNGLRYFPTTMEEFRRLKGAKLERLIAAADTVAKRPEFKALNESLDGTLDAMGMKVEGTAGSKIRAIWENSAPITKMGTQPGKISKFNLPKVNSEHNPDVFESITDIEGLPTKIDNKTAVETQFPEIIGNDEVYKTSRGSISHGGGITGKGLGKFWDKTIKSVGSRYGSSFLRKAGLGLVGGGLGYELGGSIAGAALGASFGSSVSGVRGNTLAKIRAAATRFAPKAGKALDAVRGRIGALTTRIDGTLDNRKIPPAQQFKDRVEEIQSVGPSFADKAFQIVEPLVGEQPEFAKAVHDTLTNAFNVLVNYLPRDPGMAFSKGKSLWSPTPIEIAQTSKVLSVYHNPIDVIDHLIDSKRPDTFTVSVLKNMWPSLYEEFRSELLIRVSDIMDSLSYEDQAHFSALTDFPIHSSFTARSIGQSQAIYANEGAIERAEKQERMSRVPGNSGGGRPSKSEPPTAGQSLLN